jgi:hypothetical protein
MYFDGHSENQNPSAEKSVEQPEIAEKDDAKPTSEKTEERQVPTQASLEPFASSENEQQETLEVSSDGGKTVEDLVITPDSLSTSAMPSEKTQPASAAKDQRTSQRQSYSEKIAPSASGTSNALTIELCDESGKVVRGSGESVKVGRRRDNQLVLTGSEISREHVMFFFRDGKVWVKPLTNSNITQVGGKDLKSEVKIESGAMLNLGGTNFQVRVL